MGDVIEISSDDEWYPEDNNDTKQNVTMIRSYKQTMMTTYLQPTDGKSLNCHKSANSSSVVSESMNPINMLKISGTAFNRPDGIGKSSDSDVLTRDCDVTEPKLEHNGHCELADVNQERQIQKLSDSLRAIRRRIRKYEEREVNWDEESQSSYLLVERQKQKAIDIFEKLCDLTGESRDAERIIKNPIRFTGTDYEEFNRTLEQFVNDRNEFPDIFDVERMIDDCNVQFNYRMSAAMRKDIALDAFVQIGNLLQKRRRQDSFEIVQYYTTNHTDPAQEDPTLKSKLDDNLRQFGSRIDDVIDSFSRQQYRGGIENDETSSRNDETNANSSNKSNDSCAHATTTSDGRPQLLQQMQMNIDPEIDDNDLVIPNSELQLNYYEAMDAIGNEMEPAGFFPIIVSVTSLHPSYNRFADICDVSTLEPNNFY